MSKTTTRHVYEFGPFQLDTTEQRLLRDGKRVLLTPTVFAILSVLVRNGGHLVEKDEMLNEVWPNTFVDEANLSVHISALRRLLGETPDSPQYIETVPRRGYRFVAPVRELCDSLSELAVGAKTVDGTGTSGREAFREQTLPASAESGTKDNAPVAESSHTVIAVHNRSAVFSVTALIIIGLTIAMGLRFSGHKQPGGESLGLFRNIRMTRLTSTGNAVKATISRDGNYVAEVLGDAARQSLWLRRLDTDGQIQIVSPAEVEYLGLAFSHDGSYVFYAVRENNKPFGVLYKIPVPGGTPRKLIEGISRAITLSPDSEKIAFVRDDRSLGESILFVVHADGSEERKLTSRKLPDHLWSPAWSPDGGVIICAGARPGANGRRLSLIEVRVADGVEKEIGSQTWKDILYLAWLPDSSGLVMTARDEDSGLFQIWQLTRASGEARKLTNDLNNYWFIGALSGIGTLAAVQTNRVSSIWTVPVESGSALFGSPGGFIVDMSNARPITSGAGKYHGLSWTPDGRLVYASNTNENNDIWIMERDGNGQRQLTFGAYSDLAPSVSPDGRYILFASDRSGTTQIWRTDLEGGNPKQLTGGADAYWPQCSPDGRWVVYSTGGVGRRLLKVSIDGGEPGHLTDKDTMWPAVSPDGKLVACFYRDEQPNSPTKIAVVPFEGGPLKAIADIAPTVVQRTGMQWTTDGRALAYIDNRGGVSNIWLQPLDGGASRQLSNFKDDQMFSFAWSRDGKLLACSRGVHTSDVVLISDSK